MRCRVARHYLNSTHGWLLCGQYRIGRPCSLVRRFCCCTLPFSVRHYVSTSSFDTGRLINSSRSRASTHGFRSGGITTRQLQTSQGAQEINAENEIEEEEAGDTIESEDISEEWLREQELYANPDGAIIAPIDTYKGIPVAIKPSQRLIRIFRRYPLHALPAINVHPLLSRETTASLDGTLDGSEPAFRVELNHDEYGISCSKIITTSDLTSRELNIIFEDLARECMLQISRLPEPSDGVPQDVKKYFIDQLLAMLELEQLRIECDVVEFKNDQGRILHIYQAQPFAGQEPLGRPQIWSDSGIAKRLARAIAHADLMERAEQAGIDLQQIREANPLVAVSKRDRKRSLELPRVQDPTPRVYDFSINQQCISAMLRTLHGLRRAGLPDQVSEKGRKIGVTTDRLFIPNEAVMRKASRALKNRERKLPISPEATLAWEQRKRLPIREQSNSDRIWEAVQNNDVVILVSETGSGKSTQLPQILLERSISAGYGASCNIICTQPRRLAATSVAKRVAEERDTGVGANVGYQVRFDQKRPKFLGSINYSTAGVVLSRMQTNPTLLDGISHIIIDEVHERDLAADILMTFVRDLMRIRKRNKESFPKIILMSATLKATDYENYFIEGHKNFTPRVETIAIPGRAFSVACHTLDDIVPTIVETYGQDTRMMTLMSESRHYLEWEDEYADGVEQPKDTQQVEGGGTEQKQDDGLTLPPSNPLRDCVIPYKLIVAVVAHILKIEDRGDILVFLPGMMEIESLSEILENELPPDVDFANKNRIRLFKLHSQLYETNYQVFEEIPPGCRRIILATNIAQTSITLPDVTHVIDSGKRKDMVYDQTVRKHEFRATWIDKATCLQRRGRAGRVQDGNYWAMFTEARFHSMPEHAHPEMLVTDLTSSSLVVKACSDNIDLQAFFARTLDAPSSSAIATCIEELQEMGMLTAKEKITPLGRICADFPLHPAMARGLLLGRLFGCFRPLMIAASHPAERPLVFSRDDRKLKLKTTLAFAGVSEDDQYAVVQAFLAYDRAISSHSHDTRAELESLGLRNDTYRDMLRVAGQLYELLDVYGLIGEPAEERLSNNSNIFGCIPDEIDQLGDSMNLFKALKLTTVHTNLAVWDETEEAWLSKGIKCMLRPNSVNTKEARHMLSRPIPRKHGELIGFGEMIRNVVLTPRPYLFETSSITPLVGMLFGGPLRMVDNETIEIDGWLRYRVKLARAAGDTTGPAKDTLSPVAVILEVRKALERFTNLAFRDMKPESITTLDTLPHERNPLFWPTHHRLGDTMRDGLLEILNADAEHWDEVVYLT